MFETFTLTLTNSETLHVDVSTASTTSADEVWFEAAMKFREKIAQRFFETDGNVDWQLAVSDAAG